MAHETATLTFQLEDEFSAKFAEIVGKLDEFKKRLDDATKTGKEGFKSVADQVKEVGDRSHGVNSALSSMRTHMAEGLNNFNRSLAGSVEHLGKFEGRLTNIGSTIRDVAKHFGPAATAIGGIGGAAAAAAGSVWLLGRNLSQTYVHMQNLQIQLGMSEQAIVTFERAFARFGKGPEEAHTALQKLNDAIEETRKMSESSVLNRLRTGIAGTAGPEIANAVEDLFRKIREKKISKEEGIKYLLENIYGVQTKEEVKRVIADALGSSIVDLEQLLQHLKDVIPPTVFSDQMKAALANLNNTISTEMEKISNAWTEQWNKMGPGEINKINTAIGQMGEALRALVPILADEVGKAIGDFNRALLELKGFVEWFNKTPLRRMQEHQREQGEDANQPGGNWLQRWWNRFRESKGLGGGAADTPQRFMGDGGPADLSGLRINRNWNRMINDPQLQAMGRAHMEYAGQGVATTT